MSTAETAPRRDQIPLGILYMVASSLLFAVVNAVVKWLIATYPVGEIAFLRSLFALVPCYVMILPRTGLAVLRTNRLRDHLKRALSQFCSMMSMFIALLLMPIASAVAISFAAPLFTTLLSILVLKEKVGLHRWSALLVGFVGVLVVTHPGVGTFNIGAGFALLNAVMISTVAIAIRRMSASESTETLIVYQLTLIAILTGCLLPFGVAAMSWPDFLMIAVAGIGNGVAQFWWTRSLGLAPPSAVVPFNYLSLVWAAILGMLVWGDVPGLDLILGSVIVIGSGLYILWRETIRRRRPRS
jgi:drug/metabolite transporter (DMT)-like permease